MGTGKDPRQMEEENNHLKEQVRYLTYSCFLFQKKCASIFSAFNSSLVSTTSSLNERMGKMATVINEQVSFFPMKSCVIFPIPGLIYSQSWQRWRFDRRRRGDYRDRGATNNYQVETIHSIVERDDDQVHGHKQQTDWKRRLNPSPSPFWPDLHSLTHTR